MFLWAAWYISTGSKLKTDDILFIIMGIGFGLYFGLYAIHYLFTRMTIAGGSAIILRPFRLPAVIDLKDIKSFNYIYYAPLGGSERRQVCRMITLYTSKKTYRVRYTETMMHGDWEMLNYLSDNYPRGAY